MEDQNKLRSELWQELEEETAEYGRQNRQRHQHNERIKESTHTAREEVYHRTNNGRQHCKHNTDLLADFDHLQLICFRLDELFVDIKGEHGIDGVEERVERGQDRAEHDSREKAHQRSRNDLHDHGRVRIVHHGDLRTVQLEQCVSDNTRQSQIHKADDLERCAQQSTLLCFLQILCSEYALYIRLIGAPRLQAENDHARKYGRPRNSRCRRFRRSDRVEHIRMVLDQVAHTLDDTTAVCSMT